MPHNNRFIFTGGPGAGKTTVLKLLHQHGHATLPDSARRLIRQRLRRGLPPRPDPLQFATDILTRDIRRYDRSRHLPGPIFFDRGIPDALGMLHGLSAISLDDARRQLTIRPFNTRVFFFPPWPDIYTTDSERDQDFDQATRVANLILSWYEKLDYELLHVPPGPAIARLQFVLASLSGN